MISLIILQKNSLLQYSKDWWQTQVSHAAGQIDVIGCGDAVVGVGFGYQQKNIQRFIESEGIICHSRQLTFDQLINFQNIRTLGTPFQAAVWQALLEIPRGSVQTYADIAARIGHPKAVRAVGTAIGANPVSILIPCHRVVPKAGGIGQYHLGANVKSVLLEWEGGNGTTKSP